MLEQKTSTRQARVKSQEKSREDNVTSRKDKQKTVRLFLSFLDFCQWDPSFRRIRVNRDLWCTVETAKFGSHFCSDFSAELCSLRTWKILLSSDNMDELLSSDHMNELCNYELKSSDICSELLSCQNQ